MKLLTKTRMMGIALLLIAILAYFTKQKGMITIFIASAILLLAPNKHAEKSLDKLILVIKNWKTILMTALYDSIFWAISIAALFWTQYQIQTKIQNIPTLTNFNKESLANPALAPAQAAGMETFVWYILKIAAILAILIFTAYTISRLFIWITIAKQKLNKKLAIHFSILNLLWWIIWAIPFVLITLAVGKTSTGVKETYALLFGLYAYFAPILHTNFMKTHKKSKSIGNAFAWGITKIHKFILPYTYVFVIYFIVYQLFRFIQTTQYLQPVSMIFVVLIISLLRIYIYEIVKEYK